MLFERTANAGAGKASPIPTPHQKGTSAPAPSEPPLTCMIYFFASQMGQNTLTRTLSSSSSDQTTPITHPLDKLLKQVGVHAALSPLITQFETFPVEIPQPPGPRRSNKVPMPREVNHDTMLLVKFRSQRAREEWIATREWRDFMERTESEGVFRRIPHVRCAGSVRGLSDPLEVLGL